MNARKARAIRRQRAQQDYDGKHIPLAVEIVSKYFDSIGDADYDPLVLRALILGAPIVYDRMKDNENV